MKAHQKLMRVRDRTLREMGWNPRRFDVPKEEGSARQIGDGLASRAHAAMVRRIKG